MPKISLIRQCLTHLAVALIFFQLGTMTTSSNCVSLSPSAGRSEGWDLKMNRERIRNKTPDSKPGTSVMMSKPLKTTKNTPNAVSQTTTSRDNHQLKKDFFQGMAWIPREKFVKTFDTGIAIDNAGGKNTSVLLLYGNKKSLPGKSGNKNDDDFVRIFSDPLEATENCDELQVVLTSTKRNKRCISILENWGGSPHIYRFLRWKKGSDELHLGGRFFDPNGGAGRWQKVSALFDCIEGSFSLHV